jgi:D-sedoheptulose 7-phosphate isomerase
MHEFNIRTHGDELIELTKKMISNHTKTIKFIADTIVSCLKSGNKVIIFGNGGSYADACHFAAEIEGSYKNRQRKGMAAMVPGNIASLTAIANDFSYEDIFRRNIEALGNNGDIVIGLSTSGDSGNIIKAFEYAKIKGIKTIAFTGETGGKMKEGSDILLNVPSKDTPRIQEMHKFAYHEICEIVEKEMFKG